MEKALKEATRAAEALEVASQSDDEVCWLEPTRPEEKSWSAVARAPQPRTNSTKPSRFMGRWWYKEGQGHLLDELALTSRRLSRSLLSLKEVHPAAKFAANPPVATKELWSRDRKGPWLDEISRNQLVSSAISILLKEYGTAEEEIQRSAEHFSALLDQGNPNTSKTSSTPRCNAARTCSRSGCFPRPPKSLGDSSIWSSGCRASFSQMDFRLYLTQVYQTRAKLRPTRRPSNRLTTTMSRHFRPCSR